MKPKSILGGSASKKLVLKLNACVEADKPGSLSVKYRVTKFMTLTEEMFGVTAIQRFNIAPSAE